MAHEMMCFHGKISKEKNEFLEKANFIFKLRFKQKQFIYAGIVFFTTNYFRGGKKGRWKAAAEKITRLSM